MQTQRKFLVAIITLFAFLSSPVSGPSAAVADDMHWQVESTPGATQDASTYTIATCDGVCGDDMHW